MKVFNFKINGNDYRVNIRSMEDSVVEMEVNGSVYSVELEEKVPVKKTPKLVRSKTPAPTGAHAKMTAKAKISKIIAPLPGTILQVNVKEGDTVEPGQQVMLMEAMKMENKVLAETGGTVTAVKAKEGDNVLQDAVLVELG